MESEKKLTSSKGKHRRPTNAELEALLVMYRTSPNTTAEIAARFGLTASSVTNAAKQAGLRLRHRGRKPLSSPSPASEEILREAWCDTYANVGRRHRLSRQRVGQVVGKWHDWAVMQFGPRKFNSGQRLLKSEPIRKSPRPVQPHVISFRVTDSVFAEILRYHPDDKQTRKRSPHRAARSLLLQVLGNDRRGTDSAIEQPINDTQ